jgi:hypothetical protein
MFTVPVQRRRTWLVSALLLTTLTGALAASTAYAKVIFNTIDPVAILAGNGRQIAVTGPIEVTAGERTAIRVTITQRSTGALAEGEAFFTGTGSRQQWEVRATTLAKATFEPGPATVVAVAVTRTSGYDTTDAHQWLVNITLERQ